MICQYRLCFLKGTRPIPQTSALIKEYDLPELSPRQYYEKLRQDWPAFLFISNKNLRPTELYAREEAVFYKI